MTRKQIMLDTFQYYEEDPSRRALHPTNGTCLYKAPNGNMCAIGRQLNWDKLNEFDISTRTVNESGSFSHLKHNIETGRDRSVYEFFKDGAADHSIDFWEDLQGWHDNPYNWDCGTPESSRENDKLKLLLIWAEKEGE